MSPFKTVLRSFLKAANGLLLSGLVLFIGSASAFADRNNETFANEHRSLLTINRVAPGGETRHVKIGLNKSMVVELPRDVRDVLVSNPEIIDAVLHSSRRAYLIGKKLGEGNAFFFDKSGKRILTVEIAVSKDMSALSGMLGRILRDSKVKVDMVNEHIVLTGSVRTPGDATKAADIAARFVKSKEEVINLLKASANEQVYLKVTVAEMQRNVAKQMGIDLEALASSDGLTFSALTNMVFANTGILSSAAGAVQYQNGNDSITGVIRALEANGVLRTLAEPNLTAISGETANFLAGGEFPIPVSEDDDGIRITFKPFGVGLAFTPVVMNENRINLKISTEVSELSSEGAVTFTNITVPGIKVRRASTTVELASGGSIVMAGLISDSTKHNLNDVPELKRLPILGSLFRSRDFVRNETELVVIVTPYLVNETSANKLKTPDNGLGIPSDRKAFLKGHVNKYDRYRRGRQHRKTDVFPADWSVKDTHKESYKRVPERTRKSRPWVRRNRVSDREFGFIVE